MAIPSAVVDVRGVMEEIKQKGNYSSVKSMYESWGVKKSKYQMWLSRNSVPSDQAIMIASMENVSLDWFYMGRNSIKSHATSNPKSDEIVQLIACLEDGQKEALLGFVQSLANASPTKSGDVRAAIDAKLVLLDFLNQYLSSAFGAAAKELNKRVGVVSWIKRRDYARFTVDELIGMADDVAKKEGKKITLIIE